MPRGGRAAPRGALISLTRPASGRLGQGVTGTREGRGYGVLDGQCTGKSKKGTKWDKERKKEREGERETKRMKVWSNEDDDDDDDDDDG